MVAGGEGTWGNEWKVVNVSLDEDFALGSARAYAKLLRLHKLGLLRPLPVLADPLEVSFSASTQYDCGTGAHERRLEPNGEPFCAPTHGVRRGEFQR